MSAATPQFVVNHLIESLPQKERAQFLRGCEPVNLVFGTVLCEPDQRIRHVYFPLTGFISLVAEVTQHPPLEMGLIGNEGMLGATLLLGVGTAPMRGVVQGDGTALRMSATALRDAMHDSTALRTSLSRYLYLQLMQLSQTTVCTQFHAIEERLARWLLMTHDRAHADHFHLTHQFLAGMLGVQRGAVTIAAGALKKQKLIGYSRGEISILSRSGLEAAACECYDVMEQHAARLFP